MIHGIVNGVVAGAVWERKEKEKKRKEKKRKGKEKTTRDVTRSLVPVGNTERY